MVENKEERDKYLNIILEETLRLRRLVDELLELSHIEAGHLKIKKEIFSVKDLVERIYKKVLPFCKHKNIKLVTETGDMATITADGDRIEQVLINLVDNAIRYSPKGGRIVIKAQPFKEGVVISVGQWFGNTEEQLPFIWEKIL